MKLKDLDNTFVQQITEIETRVHRNPWSKNAISLQLNNPIAISKGVFLDSEFIGYLLGQHFDHEFHILNLAIDKNYQRRGFGYYLLSQSITELFKKGAKACFLEARPSNAPALRLYKKLGFKNIAVRKKYYQDNLEDALVLTLELEQQGMAEHRFGFGGGQVFDLGYLD